MVSPISISPVRPQPSTSSGTPGGAERTTASETDGVHRAQVQEEEIDFKDVLVDAPIVGVEHSTAEELNAFAATPIRSPKPMTLAEKRSMTSPIRRRTRDVLFVLPL